MKAVDKENLERRITVRMSKALWHALKKYAVEYETSMNGIIVESIEKILKKEKSR